MDRIKTTFITNVSHELRTPLALILAPTERVLSELAQDDPHRRDLDLVLRNARVLLGHVNDLLDASKIEASKLQLEYRPVNLARVVRLISNNFETLALDRGIQFAVITPAELPAQLDAGRLQQILLNLLSNAFKFTPRAGTVRLELTVLEHATRTDDDSTGGDVGGESGTPVVEGPMARIEVADSGPGIPAADRHVVFERFHQLEGSPDTTWGSTGLGLNIARDLVQLHRGSVGVGDAPEGGALFFIELPLSAPPGAEVRTEGPKPHPATVLSPYLGAPRPVIERSDKDGDGADKPETKPGPGAHAPVILVIEDNADMNQFVCDALSSDYRVVSAYDGREGLEQALAIHPDVIVCDFMMPEMAGDDLVRRIRAEPSMDTSPILILTARNDAAARIDVLREGANDYLLKPFYQPELRARVDNLIKVKQAEEQLRALQTANDRDRIARDLHDLVIQRVFGVGMRLTAMLGAVPDVTAERMRDVVKELDGVINDIRTSIFDLQTEQFGQDGLRSGILRLTADAGDRLGFQPRVRFDGPLDTLVGPAVAEQLLAVLRESLSNVIRHAKASAVEIQISAGSDLILIVADDGIGTSVSKPKGFGLHNMEVRASALGGTFEIRSGTRGGTLLEWRVPLGTSR